MCVKGEVRFWFFCTVLFVMRCTVLWRIGEGETSPQAVCRRKTQIMVNVCTFYVVVVRNVFSLYIGWQTMNPGGATKIAIVTQEKMMADRERLGSGSIVRHEPAIFTNALDGSDSRRPQQPPSRAAVVGNVSSWTSLQVPIVLPRSTTEVFAPSGELHVLYPKYSSRNS